MQNFAQVLAPLDTAQYFIYKMISLNFGTEETRLWKSLNLVNFLTLIFKELNI